MTAPLAAVREPAGTIAVVATTGRLLDPLVETCASIAPTERWTPLASPAWLDRAPGALGAFARRRPAGDVTAPAMLALDAALRSWAGDKTDRRYRAEFLLRTAIDAWAAREVTRRRPRVVIAPSLAARRTFATARAIGSTCVLVIDIPLLRALHRDLDRAATAWPERAFLRRYRAPGWAIARQEAERVLADLVLVRGAYAHTLCVADGITRLAYLPTSTSPAAPEPPSAHAPNVTRIRLAGLAAARTGVDTALAVARMLGATLVVRAGEGTEPADLLARANVATDDGPVDAIICPAICETYAPELRAQHIPVIASPMASADGRGPDPYDAAAFASAIAAATPHAHESPPSLAPLLASLV